MDHSVKVGASPTPLLTDTAPTDLTVATHSPLGAQEQSDSILRVLCGRLVPGAQFMSLLDALKEARLPQIQPAGEQERLKCAIGLPQAVLRKHTPGSRTGAHGRNG